jgi:anti-anti-sigma regulatory factor
MVLQMLKFGNILNSRPAGREAALRAKQIINGSNDPKGIVLDFSGVEVLTPSFADEFVKGLKEIYQGKKITFEGIANSPVIKDTLTALGFIS